MNTKINLTYKGEQYVLEYDRNSVKILENSCFVLNDFLQKPMLDVERVFAAAFIKNHKKTQQTTIDKIFAACPDKTTLIKTLGTMINETYDALLSDEDENSEGNATWEVVDLSPKTEKK